MERKPKTERRTLVLNRTTMRVLDEDSLHQARGGAGRMPGSKQAEQQMVAD